MNFFEKNRIILWFKQKKKEKKLFYRKNIMIELDNNLIFISNFKIEYIIYKLSNKYTHNIDQNH